MFVVDCCKIIRDEIILWLVAPCRSLLGNLFISLFGWLLHMPDFFIQFLDNFLLEAMHFPAPGFEGLVVFEEVRQLWDVFG